MITLNGTQLNLYGSSGARVDIVGTGNTSYTYSLVIANNSTTYNNFYVRDDGYVYIRSDASIGGNATAADFILSSDTRLKTNITPIMTALTKLEHISGYTFEFTKHIGKRRSGVLAQEIQEILPEAVYTDSDGYLSVSYDALIPLLIQAIKELREEAKK